MPVASLQAMYDCIVWNSNIVVSTKMRINYWLYVSSIPSFSFSFYWDENQIDWLSFRLTFVVKLIPFQKVLIPSIHHLIDRLNPYQHFLKNSHKSSTIHACRVECKFNFCMFFHQILRISFHILIFRINSLHFPTRFSRQLIPNVLHSLKKTSIWFPGLVGVFGWGEEYYFGKFFMYIVEDFAWYRMFGRCKNQSKCQCLN